MTDAVLHPEERRRRVTIGLAAAMTALVLDQLTKSAILHWVMQPPRLIELTPFFNLVLGWNRGVSFGMFNTHSEHGPLILSAIAAAIVIGLTVWLWKSESRWTALALGLIIGGAIGNVVDRLQYGAVVDFLDFHAFGYHWPAFNVADTAIVCGAAALIGESLFAPKETS